MSSDVTNLFSRDPFSLTREDIEDIVKTFRASRHKFNAGNMRAGSTKPKTEKQKQAEKIAASLGELGL